MASANAPARNTPNLSDSCNDSAGFRVTISMISMGLTSENFSAKQRISANKSSLSLLARLSLPMLMLAFAARNFS